jgi:lysophospholipase L1-like esterase
MADCAELVARSQNHFTCRFLMLRYTLYLGILQILLLASNLNVHGQGSVPSPTVEQRPVRYLALGDSYTIGEAVTEDERWPMQLRDSLLAHGMEMEWYKIIAHAGWKSRELREAIDQVKPDKNYNLVSLLIGVNDFFQGRSIDEYKTRFQQLLDIAVAHAGGRKDRVFVVSIPDYSYTPRYKDHQDIVSKGIDAFNVLNRKITLAAGIQYIDITILSRRGLSDPHWVSLDGLHPSGEQYTAWVKAMLPTVLQMLRQ